MAGYFSETNQVWSGLLGWGRGGRVEVRGGRGGGAGGRGGGGGKRGGGGGGGGGWWGWGGQVYITLHGAEGVGAGVWGKANRKLEGLSKTRIDALQLEVLSPRFVNGPGKEGGTDRELRSGENSALKT